MSLAVTTVGLASLSAEREAHFRRLGEGPELYLELLLRSAMAYRLRWRGASVGYCLKSEDGYAAELDLQRCVWPDKAEIFAALADRIELPGARCFSFDSLLLGLCIERRWAAALEGLLFRDLLDERGPTRHQSLGLRPATAADLESILPHREGVFETEEECREWVARGHVSVLEKGGAFLGIGLLTRVWSTRPEHDVGVMVHPEHRGQGYASHILRELKRRCLDAGMRPTAGCAAQNVASSRALRRAGFASQHSLFRFTRAAP